MDKRDDTEAPPSKRQAVSTRASFARSKPSDSAKAPPVPKASPSVKSRDEKRSTPRKAVARVESLLAKRTLSSAQNAANMPPSEHDNSKRIKSSNKRRPPLPAAVQISSRATSNPSKVRASARLTLDPFGMVLGEAYLAKENPANDEETES